MKIIAENEQNATIEFSLSDVLILNNALNEILHGIDVQEFHTRIGEDREDVEVLLRAINNMYCRMSKK